MTAPRSTGRRPGWGGVYGRGAAARYCGHGDRRRAAADRAGDLLGRQCDAGCHYLRHGAAGDAYVIATGMALLAAGNLWLAWRGDFPARESFDPKAIMLILGGLAALIAIIGLGGGFIPATAILFAATATAFGRRAIHIDLAIGLVLAVVVFLLFDKLLTLSLPAGPIERLL